MPAQAERSISHSSSRALCRAALLAAFGVSSVLATVAVGVLALLGTSWLRRLLESWINIHVLFGSMLCGLVLVGYEWRVRRSTRMEMADIRELSRQLSRIVYVLLYAVIGARQIMGILDSRLHGGAIDLLSIDEHIRRGPDSGMFDPNDDFQLFFFSGIFALVFVRILAARLGARLARSGAASMATDGLPFQTSAPSPIVGLTRAAADRPAKAETRRWPSGDP